MWFLLDFFFFFGTVTRVYFTSIASLVGFRSRPQKQGLLTALWISYGSTQTGFLLDEAALEDMLKECMCAH